MIILKLIGYSILYGGIGAILFFCIGLYFEIDTRDTETQLKYDNRKKEYYKETVVVEEDISGNMTAYFAIAGCILGIIAGVVTAFDTPIKKTTTDTIEISSTKNEVIK